MLKSIKIEARHGIVDCILSTDDFEVCQNMNIDINVNDDDDSN